MIKIIREKMRSALHNQSGMTMVEILVAFVVLDIWFASLSGVMAFSSKLLQQSIDMNRVGEHFQEIIYKSSINEDLVHKPKQIAEEFYLKDKSGKSIKVEADYCAISSEDFDSFEQGEKDVLNVEVYYFKTKKNTTGI